MKISMKPVTQTFKLSADPEGLTTITIKQATNGDNIRRNQLMESQSWSDDPITGERKLTIRWNPARRARLESFLTLAGADLEDEDTGKPLFRFKDGKNGPELAMTEQEFNYVWDHLPQAIVDEIYEFVLQVNPQWDPLSGE